jgi:hypothetical protein
LDTLLYRLPTLPEARWHERLTGLAAQGIALEPPAKPLEKPLGLVEGTGWGFDTPYYAPYRRGAARRQMRSHGKGVVWGYWRWGVAGGGVVGGSVGERGTLDGVVVGSVRVCGGGFGFVVGGG